MERIGPSEKDQPTTTSFQLQLVVARIWMNSRPDGIPDKSRAICKAKAAITQ